MFGESALNGLNCIDEECEVFYYLKTHLKMSKDQNIILTLFTYVNFLLIANVSFSEMRAKAKQ